MHMYLEKYTDEEDLYINNLVSDLDSYGYSDDQDVWIHGSEELSTIGKIKNRIKKESRDSKLSNLLNTSLEKRWMVIDEPYDGRNYYLFSKLAGVRNYNNIDCISEPRGVPDDLSLFYEIKTNQWEGDGHSHSYFYLSELLEHDFSEISPDFSDFVESFRGKEDIDDYRIVFFFDN